MTSPAVSPTFRAFTAGSATSPPVPLVGGLLHTYAAGTTTYKDTFTDDAGTVANVHPTVLDARGEATVRLGTGAYKFVLTNSLGAQQGPTVDNIRSIEDWLATSEAALRADMASTATSAKGTGMLGWLRNATGAVATTLYKLLGWYAPNVAEFMTDAQRADCELATPVLDVTAAIQAAIDSLGARGGKITKPNHYRCRIASNLTVRANVSFDGMHEFVGSPQDNTAAPYGTMGALVVSSAVTITLKGGASLKGQLIHRDGMTFPAADSSGFAGTALTIGGDDTGLSHCMVLGFNKVYYSAGYSRPRLESCNFDGTNCVEIASCLDVPYLSSIHCWPFATIAALGVHETIERTGRAFYCHDTVDWGKLSACFSYGYAIGFHLENVNSNTLDGCGADNTFSGVGLHVGSIGAEVTISSSGNRLINFQTSAQGATGLYINTTAGLHTYVDGFSAWYNTGHNALVDAGDVTFSGGETRNAPYGISVNNVASKVQISGMRFNDISVIPIYLTAAGSNVKIGQNDYGNWPAGSPVAGSNQQLLTLVAASTLNIPANGDAFNVSGGTTINDVAGLHAGRRVMLYFTGTPTVTHSAAGTTTKVFLKGAVSRAMTAGGCLAIFHNGNTNTEEGA